MTWNFLLTLAAAGAIVAAAIVNAILVFRRESRKLHRQPRSKLRRRRLIS